MSSRPTYANPTYFHLKVNQATKLQKALVPGFPCKKEFYSKKTQKTTNNTAKLSPFRWLIFKGKRPRSTQELSISKTSYIRKKKKKKQKPKNQKPKKNKKEKNSAAITWLLRFAPPSQKGFLSEPPMARGETDRSRESPGWKEKTRFGKEKTKRSIWGDSRK